MGLKKYVAIYAKLLILAILLNKVELAIVPSYEINQ